jgi:nicotinamidase/pyrazinamidase
LQKNFSVGKTDALIVVDVQNDFCPGGALPVPEGDQIIPAINEYITIFKKANAGVFATRDWHPPNHVSFKAQGGPWPPHCIQNTQGAEFHPDLKLPADTTVVSKATNPLKEAYSGFDDTNLSETLQKQGVTRVFVGGLATDYCVKNTVLDASKLGFETVLLSDATAAINAQQGDAAKAVNAMTKNGTQQATLKDLIYPSELPPTSDPDDENLGEKTLSRMRPRGQYKQIRTERG